MQRIAFFTATPAFGDRAGKPAPTAGQAGKRTSMKRTLLSAAVLVLAALTTGRAYADCTPDGLAPYDKCQDVDFNLADWTGRDLHNITLHGGSLAREVSGANLSHSTLSSVFMVGITGIGTNFSDTFLNEGEAYWADFTGANFSRARFGRFTLDFAKLNNADLTEARAADASFIDAQLTNAKLTRAAFVDVVLAGANLANADLTGASFIGTTTLAKANLTNAVLLGASLPVLPNALRGADLSGATWVDGTKCAAGSVGRCNPVAITGAPDMAVTPIRPQPGLWRAAEGGTGYLFDVTGTGLRLVVIGFDALGLPSWSIAEGRLGRDNVFTAGLKSCTGTGTGPADCSTDLGMIIVSFDSATSASLLAPSAAAVQIAPVAQN